MKKNKIFVLGAILVIALLTYIFIPKNDKKEVSFLVGHKNGGGAAALQTIISEDLVKKGWKVDFKVVGNCGQVKEMMNSTDKSIIAGWASNWNADKTNTCYKEVDKKNFVNTFVVLPRLICGPVGEPNFVLESGKKYRIGVNAGQNHQVLLNDLGAKIGVTFEVIEYKNSGFIERAMKGKEIDMWYTNSGLDKHGKTQKCFYTTATTIHKDIKMLDTVLSTPNVYTSFLGFLIVNDGINPKVKELLTKDIKSIISSDTYQKKIASKGGFASIDNDADQIKVALNTALAYKK